MCEVTRPAIGQNVRADVLVVRVLRAVHPSLVLDEVDHMQHQEKSTGHG